ncbi:unnamed protein product [Zymoseptoria tritici ST99CH_1E4]|uniref:Uncharacterized protein n=1 Tax=Zymoseptoria tritici ST99CH_1E4 TaxID=1276532 RepID=A0A2H1GYJ7_ZYMTR|nr:unnamed protein product [Zymoseptoria tritici ST99CH_1E4]
MAPDVTGDGAMADIAVIGMGCRFPGDAKSPTEFHEMLLAGRSGWSEVPKDRFNVDAYWHPSHDRKGATVSRGGHFLSEDVGLFDAPAEANAMDPQHRMLLEVTYETLENAGVPMSTIVGSDMSCYVGGFSREYHIVCSTDLNDTLPYTTTGNGLTMMSNRLSWFYDIRGPSMTLDTACSSSLVALSLAVQNIRDSKSTTRQSLVAGSNLILLPDQMTAMNPLNFLSPDSQCYSFDERANGYVRGEGVGVVLLKHIDDARRDGDYIRGVIRNVVCNQDGRTPGITLPSSDAQVSLIRQAYESAGLGLDETGYFEAHGTGTAAGDPLEVSAIAAAFQREKEGRKPLLIGSVKPNIGHLEGGAGMAGLIKTILALESGIIPGNILFENANPRLGLESRNLKVVVGPTAWPREGLRRASVNSFGYGGTNAHCIVDDAEHYLAARGLSGNTQRSIHTDRITGAPTAGVPSADSGFVSESSDTESVHDLKVKADCKVFIMSAPDQAALSRIVRGHADYLQACFNGNAVEAQQLLQRLAFTYSNRRTTFQWRQAVIANSIEALVAKLQSNVVKPERAGKNPLVLFCFTGQGAQWYGMGRELLRYEVFRRSIQTADDCLRSLGATWSALRILEAKEVIDADISAPGLAQPLCTVLQVALVDLLAHWNILPSAVVGHSSGEIAAAYATGTLSAVSSWQVAFHRGRLAEELARQHPNLSGGMMAVGLSRTDTEMYIQRLRPSNAQVVSVACCNSPESTTVSGDVGLLDQLEAKLKDAGVFVRRLRVKMAYHSKHMQLLAADYRESLRHLAVSTKVNRNASVAMYSSVTGALVLPEDLGADYWVQNMVSPVLFDAAVQSALQRAGSGRRRITQVVEIGPAAALAGPLRQILGTNTANATIAYHSILQRKENAQLSALTTAGALWSAGVFVDIARVNSRPQIVAPWAPVIELPRYPWNHETRYWQESTLSKSLRFRHSPRTDLLGEPIREFSWAEPTWKNYIHVSEQPWIADHVVRGSDVFPAAAMICAAIEGVKQCAVPGKMIKSCDLRDVAIRRALVIPASDPGLEVFTKLRPQRRGTRGFSNWYDFSFESLEISHGPERRYKEHCSGQISIVYDDDNPASVSEYTATHAADKAVFEHAEGVCTRAMTAEEHYAATARIGLIYGPSFQGLRAVKTGDGYATFEIEVSDTKKTMPAHFEFPYVLHPTFLDSAMQSAYQALTHGRHEGEGETIVPTEFKLMRISNNLSTASGEGFLGFVKSAWISQKSCAATIKVARKDWSETLLELSDCTFTGLGDSKQQNLEGRVERRLAAKNVWKPVVSLVDTAGSDMQKLIARDMESRTSVGMAEAVFTQAAFIFLKRAVEALTPEVEATLTGHWIPYTQWLKHKYEDGRAGRLFGQARSTDNWCDMTAAQETEFLESAEQMHPHDMKLLVAVGRELSDLLTGRQQPLPIMLIDDTLSNFYADAMCSKSGLNMIRELFDLLGHENPGMKVLEIGAGTASVSVPVVTILGHDDGRAPRFGSYTFTDISTGWFAKAQEHLKPYENYVKYQRLDIELDPLEQGFEAETYDVIVASNVLHATKRIDVTLSNCFKLLKPGGKLVIGELTARLDHFGVIFGTLPGWWLSEDGRTGGPLMTQEEWSEVLLKAKFSGLDVAVAIEDDENTRILSTMVSTKPKDLVQPALDKAFIVKPYIPSDMATSILHALEQQFGAKGVNTTSLALEEAALIAHRNELSAKNIAVVSLLEVETPVFHNPSQELFEKVRTIILKSNLLLWCACNNDENGICPPEACAISGLMRVARSENPAVRPFEIRLQARPQSELHVTASRLWATISELWAVEGSITNENELSEAHGYMTVPRIMDDEPLNGIMRNLGGAPEPELQQMKQIGRPLKLQTTKNSRVETLFFSVDDDAATMLPATFVEVEAKAHGINYSDVGAASGKEPSLMLGTDAAGIVSRVGSAVTKLEVGDRVALVIPNAFRTHIAVSQDIPQVIPDSMSFEEAAATPFVFMAAYYGAVDSARLMHGEKILISQAASSLGQALVTIANHLGADIYATASSSAKRIVLERDFGFSPNRILDSSSAVFAQSVWRIAGGKGFDVVFNLFGGEDMASLCGCVSPLGRIINFNLEDTKANAPLRLGSLGRNVSFKSIDMKYILQNEPQLASTLLTKVFALFRLGMTPVSKPLVFNYTDLTAAFLAAQRSDVVGKVVLRLDETSQVLTMPHDQHPLKLTADATYVIAGGLGGVGRALACYLADCGARNFALLSRSTKVGDKAAQTIAYLESLDARVKVIGCDISNRENVESALESMADMPKVRGVVQAAMVLQDGLYENLTHEQWMSATRPKIAGSWNLHEVLPKDVDFFIMLSSIAGLIGSPGQSNYSSGNTYQDALCHYRRKMGLKATTMNLGGIGSFGWLEEHREASSIAEALGDLIIEPTELLTMFKSAVTGYTSKSNTCPTQLIMGIGSGGTNAAHIADGTRDPYFWLNAQSRFRYLRQLDLPTATVDNSSTPSANFKPLLAAATTIPDAAAIVQVALTAKLAKSLMMAPEDIDISLPTSSYGVDSLVAAELRNWCAAEVEAAMSVFELLDAKPIGQLAVDIARKSAVLSETVRRE